MVTVTEEIRYFSRGGWLDEKQPSAYITNRPYPWRTRCFVLGSFLCGVKPSRRHCTTSTNPRCHYMYTSTAASCSHRKIDGLWSRKRTYLQHILVFAKPSYLWAVPAHCIYMYRPGARGLQSVLYLFLVRPHTYNYFIIHRYIL